MNWWEGGGGFKIHGIVSNTSHVSGLSHTHKERQDVCTPVLLKGLFQDVGWERKRAERFTKIHKKEVAVKRDQLPLSCSRRPYSMGAWALSLSIYYLQLWVAGLIAGHINGVLIACLPPHLGSYLGGGGIVPPVRRARFKFASSFWNAHFYETLAPISHGPAAHAKSWQVLSTRSPFVDLHGKRDAYRAASDTHLQEKTFHLSRAPQWMRRCSQMLFKAGKMRQ